MKQLLQNVDLEKLKGVSSSAYQNYIRNMQNQELLAEKISMRNDAMNLHKERLTNQYNDLKGLTMLNKYNDELIMNKNRMSSIHDIDPLERFANEKRNYKNEAIAAYPNESYKRRLALNKNLETLPNPDGINWAQYQKEKVLDSRKFPSLTKDEDGEEEHDFYSDPTIKKINLLNPFKGPQKIMNRDPEYELEPRKFGVKNNKIEEALSKQNEMLEKFLKQISNSDSLEERKEREREKMHHEIENMESNFVLQKRIVDLKNELARIESKKNEENINISNRNSSNINYDYHRKKLLFL